MRIEDEIKLTFDDVLIRPKRSTLVSRSEVELNREFKFRHSNQKWTGIPVFSANMDTTGTFETAIALQKHNMLTAVHKFYTLKDWKENLSNLNPEYLAVTVGTSEEDFQKALGIFELEEKIKFLCLDALMDIVKILYWQSKNIEMPFQTKLLLLEM